MRPSLRDRHYGWHRRVRPFRAIGEHRAADQDIRPVLGPAIASAITIIIVGSYFTVPLLRPNGQLLPQRPPLPGIEQQIPTVEESPIERLQASDEPQAASRSRPRPETSETPASPFPREPEVLRPPNGASPPPAAAATQEPDGGTTVRGPMPTTACPPPLPPPAKDKKPKKDKQQDVGPKRVLTIFSPTPTPSS